MKPETVAWVKQAEDDWLTALRSYRSRKHPIYDHACTHAQISAEKYLKAYLLDRGAGFPKTHDLLELAKLIRPNLPELTLIGLDLSQQRRRGWKLAIPDWQACPKKMLAKPSASQSESARSYASDSSSLSDYSPRCL